MEHVILALIAMAVILSGGMILAQTAVVSADRLAEQWKETGVRTEELTRTAISATSVVDQGVGGLGVTVRNSGQVVLGQFADWDVIVQYYDAPGNYKIARMTYTPNTTPGNNEWAVNAINLGANPEVYEKGLLDPGEDMKLYVKPNPPLGNGKTILIVIGTDRGITTSIQFTK